MRLDFAVAALTLFVPAWAAAVDTGLHGSDVAFLAPKAERDNSQQHEELWKRKGGGGGGGGRGGGGGGGTSGSGGAGRGSSGSSSRGRTGDNTGGRTISGSGPSPAYGGGRYYGGGAAVPYRAGSSRGSMVPFFLVGGALAFWPGLWLAGAHMYPYSHPYRYYNETARENQTKAVLCGCAEDLPCSCEENNGTDYMNSLLGNGSYDGLNKSVVNIGEVNGTETILINGTLPSGTTAPGGSDEVGAAISSESSAFRTAVETLGFWPVAAVVLATVFAA